MKKLNSTFKRKIITTKTPLRVSFSGGGTDMPYFYRKYNGITISTSIDKFVYVTVKLHNDFKEKYRLNYSDTEIVNKISDIKNLRIRETLKYFKINNPLYINTISDLPYNTGLGSSSAFLVGLIKAILLLKKIDPAPRIISELAFKIENKITTNSLGKQDHYIASYGGFKVINYNKKNIKVKSLKILKKNIKYLQKSILFFYTGKIRCANKNLLKQKKNLKKNIHKLLNLKKTTSKLKLELEKEKINLKKIGNMLDHSWKLKKQFTNNISDKFLDKIYNDAIKSGCYGGKLLGAGGGGFFIFICKKELHYRVTRKLIKYKKIDLNFEKKGSKISFFD